MDYVSFDIETSGLDPKQNAVLEAAFVVDGDDYYHLPLNKLAWNSVLVTHEEMVCSPYVAKMHTKNGLWDAIDFNRDEEFIPEDPRYQPSRGTPLEALDMLFAQIGSVVGNRVTLAGKNVGTFDMRFLQGCGFLHMGKLTTSSCKGMSIANRVLDVGALFYEKGMKSIPDTQACCKIAGLPEVTNHRAYGDCLTVAALIRWHLGVLKDEDKTFLESL